MIDLVRKLEEKEYTYTAGGNVYFDTSRFPAYGRMALLDRQDLQHGARVGVDENKKNPHDFVLWFTKSKFGNQAMTWDSPWGTGYPGWHLECSAMSTRYLGESFDIHTGGIDHVPVHHTNEIAQSEAASGKSWVRYWLHNEFLNMKAGRMSKSGGGFLTLQALVDEGYDPLDYRYFLLGGHYRSQLIFSLESLDGARSARARLSGRLRDLRRRAGDEVGSLTDNRWTAAFREHLAEDMNTPRALADLWGLLKDEDLSAADRLAAACDMDRVLGLDLEAASESGAEEELPAELADLIRRRDEARAGKDFAAADALRDELLSRGIRLVDGPDGTGWEKI